MSAADYQILATAQPGIEIGTAQVHARLSVVFAFPVAQDGTLEEPVLEGLRDARRP